MEQWINKDLRDTTLILAPTLSGKSAILIPNIIQCCINQQERVFVFTSRKDISLGIWYLIEKQRKRHQLLHLRKAGYHGIFLEALTKFTTGCKEDAEALLYQCCYNIMRKNSIAVIFDFDEFIHYPSIAPSIKYLVKIMKTNTRPATVIFDDFEIYQSELKDFIQYSYDLQLKIFLMTRSVSALNEKTKTLLLNYVNCFITKGDDRINDSFIRKLYPYAKEDIPSWCCIDRYGSRLLNLLDINAMEYVSKGMAQKRKSDISTIQKIQLNQFILNQKIKNLIDGEQHDLEE